MALDKVVQIFNAKTVFRSFGLTGPDMAVLLEVASHENQERRRKLDKRVEDGEITIWDSDFHDTYSCASVFRLADNTGFGYSTVRKSLANLVERGVLMQVKQKKPRPHLYAVNPEVLAYFATLAPEAKRVRKEWVAKNRVTTGRMPKWIDVILPEGMGVPPESSESGETERNYSEEEETQVEEIHPVVQPVRSTAQPTPAPAPTPAKVRSQAVSYTPNAPARASTKSGKSSPTSPAKAAPAEVDPDVLRLAKQFADHQGLTGPDELHIEKIGEVLKANPDPNLVGELIDFVFVGDWKGDGLHSGDEYMQNATFPVALFASKKKLAEVLQKYRRHNKLQAKSQKKSSIHDTSMQWETDQHLQGITEEDIAENRRLFGW